MRECRKTKAIVLSMAMALALPIGATAQGGLFQRGVTDENYYGFGKATEAPEFIGNRNVQTTGYVNPGTINNQVFGQSVPVGSGIVILLTAGAGYVLLKRKEEGK